jgi:hypothetical protein
VNADTAAGTYAFLFTSGPTNSPWNNKWANVTVLMDSLQSYTYQGNTDNSITVSNGKYYQMNWADNGYASTEAVFMELSGIPVSMNNVSQSPAFVTPSDSVLISFSLSSTPSPEEHFFVRYTTTNWQTSQVVEASILSTTGEAYIPAMVNGTQVSYYILSSTKANPSYAYDLYTLELENNSGANYAYTVTKPTFQLTLDQTQYCSGSSGQLIYTYPVAFDPTNQFTIELSDASGSFNSPVNMGTYQSSASVDSFSFSIPGSATGSAYFVRIISSNPADTGITSAFSINGLPIANAIGGMDTICSGDSTLLSILSMPNETITWYAAGQVLGSGNQVVAPQGQPIWAVVANTCGSDTATFFIYANASPTVTLTATGSTALCYGDSVMLSGQTSAQASVEWTFNGQPLNVNTNAFYVNQAGKYAVHVVGNPCPAGYAEIDVTVSACGIYRPEGINIPGQWNGWVNPASNKPNLGSDVQVSGGKVVVKNIGTRRYQTLIPIGSSGDTTTGTYEFLFTSGPAANPWSNKWGGTTVVLDSLQTYTYQGQNNTISVLDGSWYTMNWADNGYADTRAIFMTTSSAPVDIVTVSQTPSQVFDGQSVTISFTLSQNPSPEEKFVVRYTTDGWRRLRA